MSFGKRRCFVIEYHGENKATFECPHGHIFKAKLFPKDPRGKYPAEALLVKFARYWSKGHSGVIMDCPRCKGKLSLQERC